MVSKTVTRSKVFSWSINFETDQQNGNWFVYYYDSNGVDMWKIRLDAPTLTLAKGLIQQITAWMNQSETWSGTVVETWKKETVTDQPQPVEKWVRK